MVSSDNSEGTVMAKIEKIYNGTEETSKTAIEGSIESNSVYTGSNLNPENVFIFWSANEEVCYLDDFDS